MPYTGDGFALLIPAKYNPSKEIDFKGVVVRPLTALLLYCLCSQLAGYFTPFQALWSACRCAQLYCACGLRTRITFCVINQSTDCWMLRTIA